MTTVDAKISTSESRPNATRARDRACPAEPDGDDDLHRVRPVGRPFEAKPPSAQSGGCPACRHVVIRHRLTPPRPAQVSLPRLCRRGSSAGGPSTNVRWRRAPGRAQAGDPPPRSPDVSPHPHSHADHVRRSRRWRCRLRGRQLGEHEARTRLHLAPRQVDHRPPDAELGRRPRQRRRHVTHDRRLDADHDRRSRQPRGNARTPSTTTVTTALPRRPSPSTITVRRHPTVDDHGHDDAPVTIDDHGHDGTGRGADGSGSGSRHSGGADDSSGSNHG